MRITYHIQISLHGDEIFIPHKVLHPEIQDYIKERGFVQKEYLSTNDDSGFYFFIYVNDNNDRIDIEL